jgi:thiol-disulfide isomerase/thioredoxin
MGMHDQARQMMWRLALLLIALSVAGCYAAPREKPPDATPASPDTAEPQTGAVELVDSSELAALIEAVRGEEIVVVNFWATWCPPCVEEMPIFVSLFKTADSTSVKFFSVSVDHSDTVDDRVKPFLAKHSIPFKAYVLRDRSSEAVANALGIDDWGGALPTTLVFGKDGKLAKSWSEGISASDLANVLNSL